MKNNTYLYLSFIFALLFCIGYYSTGENTSSTDFSQYDNQSLDDKDYLTTDATLAVRNTITEIPNKSTPRAIQQAYVVSIHIPTQNISKTVIPVGLNKRGEIDVRGNITDLVWYTRTGDNVTNIIIAGHRTWGKQKGLLYTSDDWKKGTLVEVTFDNNITEQFKLVSKYKYSVEQTPKELMNTEEGAYRVTAITCNEDGTERVYNIFKRVNDID